MYSTCILRNRGGTLTSVFNSSIYVHVCFKMKVLYRQGCIEDFFLGGGTVCNTSSIASSGVWGKIYKINLVHGLTNPGGGEIPVHPPSVYIPDRKGEDCMSFENERKKIPLTPSHTHQLEKLGTQV